MALLDIFGDTPSYYGGLLGEEELRKAQSYAQQQGLQNAAMALLQAGAPSRTPGGGALAIAQGLQMGQNAYRDAMGEALKGKLTQMQLEDMLQKRAEEKALREQQVRAQQVIQSGYRPEMGMIGNTPSQVLRDEEGNLMPLANIRPAGLDLQSVMPALRAMGPAGIKALSEQLAVEKSLRPEYKEVGGQLFEIPALGGTPTAVAGSKKRDTVTVGNSVLDKDTMEVLYTAPDAPAGSIKELQDFLKLTPEQQKAFITLQEQKRPTTTINMPTEGERKAGLFQEQMKAASNTISSLGPLDMANKSNQIAFKSAGGMGNIAIDPKIQQYKQAADQWSESYLRVKTGAAATASEVELNNKTFFPVFGDDAETVKLKERMRKKAEKDLGIMAGRAEVKNSKTSDFEMPTDQTTVIPSGVIVRKR